MSRNKKASVKKKVPKYVYVNRKTKELCKIQAKKRGMSIADYLQFLVNKDVKGFVEESELANGFKSKIAELEAENKKLSEKVDFLRNKILDRIGRDLESKDVAKRAEAYTLWMLDMGIYKEKDLEQMMREVDITKKLEERWFDLSSAQQNKVRELLDEKNITIEEAIEMVKK